MCEGDTEIKNKLVLSFGSFPTKPRIESRSLMWVAGSPPLNSCLTESVLAGS